MMAMIPVAMKRTAPTIIRMASCTNTEEKIQ